MLRPRPETKHGPLSQQLCTPIQTGITSSVNKGKRFHPHDPWFSHVWKGDKNTCHHVVVTIRSQAHRMPSRSAYLGEAPEMFVSNPLVSGRGKAGCPHSLHGTTAGLGASQRWSPGGTVTENVLRVILCEKV